MWPFAMSLLRNTLLIWLTVVAAIFGLPVVAMGTQQEEEPKSAQVSEQQSESAEWTLSDRIMVVGTADNLEIIPGSASQIEGAALLRSQAGFADVHRILRSVPGVNIQEEEGFGLRPNIGLRGSGSERSGGITLMEDGVLIAPAPYSAPSAYYFPTSGRMEAVEIRKGSSQIKFGPRTNGGALNLVSTRVPNQLRVFGEVGGGSHSSGKARMNVGNSSPRWGWLLETYQLRTEGFKHVDGGGDSGFRLGDFMGKLRYRTESTASKLHEVELKVGYTDQRSFETYLGLTDGDFAIDPMRRYAGSQGDRIDADHRQFQVRHFTVLSERLDITTVAYRNDFERDWYKLGSVNGASISKILASPEKYSQELAILRGADSDSNSLKKRHNNRKYYGEGIQTVVGLRLGGKTVSHQLEVGARYHADEEDRLQSEDGYQMLSGKKLLTSVGAPGSQSNRVGEARAWALFAQDRIDLGGLAITPGVRFESIDMTRTDFAKTDPERSSPTKVRDSHISVFVPGIGLDHRIGNSGSVFAGIHRGFAPPGPGAASGVEAETSVNYELGYRYRAARVSANATGFLNNYDNLLGSDTLSSGGLGTGDLFNGGAARIWGLEVAGKYDLGSRGGRGLSVPVSVAYTWTRGNFLTSFDSKFKPWGSVQTGDQLPYVAEHQAHLSLGLQAARWDLFGTVSAIGAMRTEAGQGPIPIGSGTGSATVVDLTASYQISDRVRLHAAVQNALDNIYIVARRPAGVRPGLPRTLMLNVSFSR